MDGRYRSMGYNNENGMNIGLALVETHVSYCSSWYEYSTMTDVGFFSSYPKGRGISKAQLLVLMKLSRQFN